MTRQRPRGHPWPRASHGVRAEHPGFERRLKARSALGRAGPIALSPRRPALTPTEAIGEPSESSIRCRPPSRIQCECVRVFTPLAAARRPSQQMGITRSYGRGLNRRESASVDHARSYHLRHFRISSRTRGITWRPNSSMLVIRVSWVRPPAPYFRSKRVAPNARRLVAIFWATVSGDPT
jgi:hypothetical protein